MTHTGKGLKIDVRSATVDDIPLLLSFIESMAEFEGLQVHANEKALQESLFSERPAADTLLAFVNGKPAAYAVYFFNFSTMTGKRGLWLDDLFVSPEFRGKGIARRLMEYLSDVAVKQDCGRFEWIVLNWNQAAIKFYEGMGAKIHDDWRICRLESDQFARLARRLSKAEENN